MNAHSETNKISRSPEKSSPEQDAKGRRGRPKGARTTSLTEVRRQAAAEKNRLKLELGNKIKELQQELHDLQKLYEEDTARLNEEIDHLKRREGNYQKAWTPICWMWRTTCKRPCCTGDSANWKKRRSTSVGGAGHAKP
ncbi:MAG: hypothetical protein R3E89_14335 [Thiolinea sp.]